MRGAGIRSVELDFTSDAPCVGFAGTYRMRASAFPATGYARSAGVYLLVDLLVRRA